MEKQVIGSVEAYWQEVFPALLKQLGDSQGKIERILILEDYFRKERSDKKSLRKSYGVFGSAALDFSTLHSLIDKSPLQPTLDNDRLQRVTNLFQKLGDLLGAYRENPPAPKFVEMGAGAKAISAAFETHLAAMAKTFALLRVAEMEAEGKFDPARHEEYFQNLGWRQLNDSEMELCPPFVVISQSDKDQGALLGDLMELVTSGKPYKIFYPRSGIQNGNGKNGSAPVIGNTVFGSPLESSPLFLSLPNVFFMQSTSAAGEQLEKSIRRGLASQRPGVFSLLLPGPEKQEAGIKEAGVKEAGKKETGGEYAKALLSRAFPHFDYDPDRAIDFGSRLDLAGNPHPGEGWCSAGVEYMEDDGEGKSKSASLERPYTFADYAAGEKEFQDQFQPLPGEIEADSPVHLAEYLQLSQRERRGKTPFVYALDDKNRLLRLLPSPAMIALTADRLHHWQTLQELSGIRNPYVMEARQKVNSLLNEEKVQSQKELRAEMEAGQAERERDAVSSAMQKLALRLLGLKADDLPGFLIKAQSAPAPSAEAPGEAPADEAPAEISEEAWVEKELCTSCDECTDINKNLFAYDKDKKAYIKDPKGGPFKDIVKSAEKCASGAIHPGKPQNPEEKGLEKLIQKAEIYQ